ncbi:MAG: GNAT family N-acetyltransferase [Eubacteriales bacterium]|nr:GNAT family N-acetyltransferase [Eubacteriales bacterium]
MSVRRVTDLSGIAPLYANSSDTLVLSTLQGLMGRAYLNASGTAALIVNGDFAFPAGDAACAEAAELVTLVPNGYCAQTLLLAPPDEGWSAVVRRACGKRAVQAERYAFRKDVNHFDRQRLAALRGCLPPGIRLTSIDGALYHQALAADWSRDFVSLFDSEADYGARGLGMMALANGEPVAGASSYAIFQGGIEIEIDTREDWRRQGLATACGAALMLECLERGLYPSWDAANPVSAALAEKLGYVFERTYPIFEIAVSA